MGKKTRFGKWHLFEIFIKKYKANTRCAMISCRSWTKKTVDHYHYALVSPKENSNEHITSAVYGTML